METRSPHWHKLVVPVGFMLACLVLYLFVIQAFGGSLPLTPNGYRFNVPLPQAANLVAGSDVQMAGVDVGEVVEVRRAGNKALATVELDEQFAPISSQATAVARTKTLLGEAYIELAPGSADAEPLPEGGRLAAEQVRPAVQLDEFLEIFDAATRRRMRQLFAGLSTALDGREHELNAALGHVAPFAGNMADVLGILDRNQSDTRRLLAGSSEVLETLGEREGALRAAVVAGNDLLDVTARRRRHLAAAVRALPDFLRQLRTTADAITVASPDLQEAVRTLAPLAGRVPPALREIQAAAPEFGGLFRELPGVIAAGNRGLPVVRPLARAARTGFAEFHPFSRELIPFMQLFALNRDAVRFTFGNTANVNAGTFVGPEGIVHRYGTGVASVWNETVSGWKHKLPTNRQNPYPKPPDALRDIGRLGYLKSYDCRHTDNPLVLPPTGTGAPPCVEQGPWEFNGKSAYYPRLELSPP